MDQSAIRKRIDEIIAPLVEADDGRIAHVAISNNSLTIRLGGACVGCPGFAFTRAHVIEPLLRDLLGTQVRLDVSNVRLPPSEQAAQAVDD